MSRRELVFFLLVAALAVGAYFAGLGSLHAPKSSDEDSYAHITRVTAATGALLPLQSQAAVGRNTKPPLLYWQGIWSTDWGRHWTLFRLRWPNVIYTLLVGVMAGLLGWRLTGRADRGFIAALAYLAFFGSFRYGRPFLTNAPENFWLCVPLFLLLFFRPRSFRSWIAFPLLLGVTTGIGLLYKSVFLLGPVGLTMAWWYLAERGYRVGEFVRRDAPKLAVVAAVSVGVFSLWFVFDPDPGAVWREFILGENVGKVAEEGYLSTLLWGKRSLWAMVFGYVTHAGLLAPMAIVVYVSGIRRRKTLTPEQRMLWIWLGVFVALFTIPGGRSDRYLLPATPAMAVLLALIWDRVPRVVLRATAGLVAGVVFAMAYVALRLDASWPATYWLCAAGALATAGAAFLRDRAWVLPAVFCCYLVISGFFHPLDHGPGRFGDDAIAAAARSGAWVPLGDSTKVERYHFPLPGAEIHGYEPGDRTPLQLVYAYPAVIVRVPLHALPPEGCRVLGERWDVRTRQSAAEIVRLLRDGDLDVLFLKELLLARE